MTTAELNTLITNCKNEIKSLENKINDWSNRVYKKAGFTVTDLQTEGEKYFKMSVDSINENRRQRNISFWKEEIKMIEASINRYENQKVVEKVEDEEFEDLMEVFGII